MAGNTVIVFRTMWLDVVMRTFGLDIWRPVLHMSKMVRQMFHFNQLFSSKYCDHCIFRIRSRPSQYRETHNSARRDPWAHGYRTTCAFLLWYWWQRNRTDPEKGKTAGGKQWIAVSRPGSAALDGTSESIFTRRNVKGVMALHHRTTKDCKLQGVYKWWFIV